jgi:hypothetical protein
VISTVWWRLLGFQVSLMFAVSSSRRENALLARERFRMAATEQAGGTIIKTTVYRALMRGLATAGPVMRRGGSSV